MLRRTPRLLMIGDSISEALRGTAIGEAEKRRQMLDNTATDDNLQASVEPIKVVVQSKYAHCY